MAGAMRAHDEFWAEFRATCDLTLRPLDCLDDVRASMPLVAPERRRWARARVVGGALAAAAAVAVLLVGVLSTTPARDALTFTVGSEARPGALNDWIGAPSGRALPVRFSDGSGLVLSPSSRARVLSTSDSGAHLVIERGQAQVRVVHQDATRWLMEAGPFKIDVVGTQFDVQWAPETERFELKLRSGAVRVSGAFLSQTIALSEGQTLVADCEAERTELLGKNATARAAATERLGAVAGAAATSELPVAAELRAGSGAVSPRGPGASSPAPSPSRSATASAAGAGWSRLAGQGRYRDAYALLAREGFKQVCAKAPGSRLVQLGDVARLSGHPLQAKQAYVKARAARANPGMAAYGLGLVAFHAEGNYQEAAHWFRTYLAGQSAGGLRPEAMARLMEAEQKSGDRSGSRRTAQAYLKAYPGGPHAALARQVLQR